MLLSDPNFLVLRYTRTMMAFQFFHACPERIAIMGWVVARCRSGAISNGFGFAVVSPQTARATRFYAHPYSFVRPDPLNPLSEGVETTNFIKSLGWSDQAVHSMAADYEEDSYIIHTRSSAGDGVFFMPFGLRQPALIINFEPASATSSDPERLQEAGISWKFYQNEAIP